MLMICYECLGDEGVVGVGDLLRMLGRRGGLLVLVISYGCLGEEGVVGLVICYGCLKEEGGCWCW